MQNYYNFLPFKQGTETSFSFSLFYFFAKWIIILYNDHYTFGFFGDKLGEVVLNTPKNILGVKPNFTALVLKLESSDAESTIFLCIWSLFWKEYRRIDRGHRGLILNPLSEQSLTKMFPLLTIRPYLHSN